VDCPILQGESVILVLETDQFQGCQIALAVLGLCYSIDRTDNYALVVTPGNVSVPNMSRIETLKTVQSNVTSRAAQEYTANK